MSSLIEKLCLIALWVAGCLSVSLEAKRVAIALENIRDAAPAVIYLESEAPQALPEVRLQDDENPFAEFEPDYACLLAIGGIRRRKATVKGTAHIDPCPPDVAALLLADLHKRLAIAADSPAVVLLNPNWDEYDDADDLLAACESLADSLQ